MAALGGVGFQNILANQFHSLGLFRAAKSVRDPGLCPRFPYRAVLSCQMATTLQTFAKLNGLRADTRDE